MIIRNWRDCSPHVIHKYAVEWPIFLRKNIQQSSLFESWGVPGYQKVGAACLESFAFLEYAFLQPGVTLEEHTNDYYEEIYFIVRGVGTMLVDGKKYRIRDGDAVYIPKKIPHGMVNDSEDGINYLVFSAGTKKPDALC